MSSRYALLTRLATDRTDAAAKLMGEAQQRMVQAGQKLAQLEQFLAEYRMQRIRRAGAGMTAVQWADYQRFLERIETAVNLQREEVARSEAEAEACRTRWLAERKKLKAFETLDEQAARREEAARARREQKLTDELATRGFHRKH